MNIIDLFESKKAKQQLILILAAILPVLIALTLLFAIWQWRIDWRLAHKPPTPMVSAENPVNTLIADIPNDHLFGQTPTGDVPISNLQLQITGIVKSISDNSASKVYISISGQPAKIYKIDDSLPDGVKIYDISKDAMILKNGGHLEKLPLAREKLQFKPRNSLGE